MKLTLLFCLSCVVIATGCARPPTKVAESVAIRDAQIVSTETVGARETLVIGEIREAADTDPEWDTTIDPVTFRQAFRQSLIENRLLGLEPKTKRYRVDLETKPLVAAGMGVAWRAKPAVAAAAPVRIDHGDLTALLYLQGYPDSEFVS